MERKKEESVGIVVDRFLACYGLLSPLNEYRAVKFWPEVVGEAVAKYCGDVYFKNGTLTVKLKSPALKADLMLRRAELIRALNEKIEAPTVADLRFV